MILYSVMQRQSDVTAFFFYDFELIVVILKKNGFADMSLWFGTTLLHHYVVLHFFYCLISDKDR